MKPDVADAGLVSEQQPIQGGTYGTAVVVSLVARPM
jgi:hypothetical protein